MQTFLPYPNFLWSAQCLDWRRLGKQRVEGYQILQNCLGISKGWSNHPAIKMWKGYENALAYYTMTIIEHWIERGYEDNLRYKFRPLCAEHNINLDLDLKKIEMPYWFGDSKFHKSHKSNLIRKYPEHYGKLWPDVPNDLEYIWPSGKVNV